MEECMVQHAIIMNEAAEKSWERVAEMNAADREFKRSRRKARYRALLLALPRAQKRGLGKSGKPESIQEPRREGAFEIELDGIAGMVDEDERLREGLPPMPKGLIKEWRNIFSRLAVDEEEYLFSIRSHDGAWYLEGGSLALARIEMLRMRGEPFLRARNSSPSSPGGGSEALMGSCCEEDMGRMAS